MMKITVDKLVYGGKGIGKIDDKICFVPYVIPGEEIEIDNLIEKKGFLECKLKSILKTSPNRKQPECKYFTYCGACDYMHIMYRKQLEIKKEIFIETLERIGKIKNVNVEKIIPSPYEFFYRNRVQFKVKKDKFGFYKKESREIINLDSCYLLKEDLNEAIIGLKEILPFFFISSNRGAFIFIIRRSDASKIYIFKAN